VARDFQTGGTDYLVLGSDVLPLDITGTAVSVFCWFQADSVDANDRVLVSKSQYVASQVQYNIGQQNGAFWFEIGDSGGTSIVSSPAGGVRAGVWHAGVGVLDGTQMIACCDGKIGLGTTAKAIQNLGHPVGIGVRTSAGGPEHDGRIAHVAIWGCSLKRDEMHRLTVLGESPRSVRPEMLRGYWPLEQYPTERDQGLAGVATMGGTVPPRPGPWLPQPAAAMHLVELFQQPAYVLSPVVSG
jgi:hypothetical protein